MAEFVKITSVDEIPEGQVKGFRIGPHRFVVAHTSEGFFSVVDECSHEVRPLSTGQIHGNEIMCQAHGGRFDLRTGMATGPPAVAPIEALQTKVEEGTIYVLIED